MPINRTPYLDNSAAPDGGHAEQGCSAICQGGVIGQAAYRVPAMSPIGAFMGSWRNVRAAVNLRVYRLRLYRLRPYARMAYVALDVFIQSFLLVAKIMGFLLAAFIAIFMGMKQGTGG